MEILGKELHAMANDPNLKDAIQFLDLCNQASEHVQSGDGYRRKTLLDSDFFFSSNQFKPVKCHSNQS